MDLFRYGRINLLAIIPSRIKLLLEHTADRSPISRNIDKGDGWLLTIANVSQALPTRNLLCNVDQVIKISHVGYP